MIKMINKTLKLTLQITLIAYFLSCSFTFASAFDVSASVLRFQTKMAERGSVESQYKLGFMYETGSGAGQNIDKAMHWYKKASAKRFQPATNRITYLKLKNTGMKHEYIRWLSQLKTSAQANDKDALFLLGQMYAEGTGVNKSLTQSLELLRNAKRKNVPSAEPFILRMEHELATLQKKYASSVTKKSTNQLSSNTKQLPPQIKSRQKKPDDTNLKPDTAKAKIKQQAKSVKKNSPIIKVKKQKTAQSSVKPVTLKSQKSNKPITRIAATTTPTEPNYSHPMDTMCGGSNRFMSGCR
jgi:Sel1 repeat